MQIVSYIYMPFKVAGVGVRSHDEKGSARVIHILCSEGVFVDFQRNKDSKPNLVSSSNESDFTL